MHTYTYTYSIHPPQILAPRTYLVLKSRAQPRDWDRLSYALSTPSNRIAQYM